MCMPKTRGLKCEDVTPGAFSGERVCHFDTYDGGGIVRVSPPAPKGYVDEKSKIVRVKAISVQGNQTYISFPIGGIGDFEQFTVPSSSLVDLAEAAL